MLTAEQIADGKRRTRHTLDAFHEHDDCIRIAYEWLDAQKIIATPNKRFRPLKHIIEAWAGRYVSQTDVEVAALLHPRISGKYPNFNMSARLVHPREDRLDQIAEANTQNQRDHFEPGTYATKEA